MSSWRINRDNHLAASSPQSLADTGWPQTATRNPFPLIRDKSTDMDIIPGADSVRIDPETLGITLKAKIPFVRSPTYHWHMTHSESFFFFYHLITPCRSTKAIKQIFFKQIVSRFRDKRHFRWIESKGMSLNQSGNSWLNKDKLLGLLGTAKYHRGGLITRSDS